MSYCSESTDVPVKLRNLVKRIPVPIFTERDFFISGVFLGAIKRHTRRYDLRYSIHEPDECFRLNGFPLIRPSRSYRKDFPGNQGNHIRRRRITASKVILTDMDRMSKVHLIRPLATVFLLDYYRHGILTALRKTATKHGARTFGWVSSFSFAGSDRLSDYEVLEQFNELPRIADYYATY